MQTGFKCAPSHPVLLNPAHVIKLIKKMCLNTNKLLQIPVTDDELLSIVPIFYFSFHGFE